MRRVAPLLLAVALVGASPPKPWSTPAGWKDKAPPFEVTEAEVKAGQAIFGQLCVSCHGPSGKGNGPVAKMLKVTPGDLTRPRPDSPGELYWKLTTGRFPMPSYEDRLKEKERWQVAVYVRTLAPSSPPATSSVP